MAELSRKWHPLFGRCAVFAYSKIKGAGGQPGQGKEKRRMSCAGRCIGFVHTVRKGDTLYLLGKKYHVRVSALIFANPYVDVYNLQVGDQICIPKLRPLS
ncbi:LysM peptidoglycan-binding domain-containing protein [Parablautia sp. Marseille-Q6255]|uniref:LysM peptidoglycan-binding domain-containing protein n=1 Tax=Parablautia sp. Marseille-Q6255 TaxID=3039593 RepID=UPI0024BC0315|nr:LysM domain-containing protein [Parablautia sp. Marseille-Q6255]